VSFQFRMRTCPQCRGNDIHRSRRCTGLERYLLPLLLLRPYRCADCDQRYFGWVFATRKRDEEAAVTPLIQGTEPPPGEDESYSNHANSELRLP
jgi:hypothetical protein